MQSAAYLIDGELNVKGGFLRETAEEKGTEEPEIKFEIKELDPKEEVKKVVMPSFFNSHVHLMDSIILAPRMPLEELVGPGGYKFRVISSADEKKLVEANRETIARAFEGGTTGFADFREMGLRGLEILKKADELGLVVPLARPASVEEAELVLKYGLARGFGMSSVRDHEFAFLEELRSLARRKGVLFGIHAGELDGGDVDGAISLEPDFLVHMNQASIDKLRLAMDADIPIISCIRSNFFFGVENRKNYSILSEYEKWGLGTDNAMIATTSMMDEISFASYILDSEDLFRAAFFGFELFQARQKWILIESPKPLKNNPLEWIARGFCKVAKVLEGMEIEE